MRHADLTAGSSRSVRLTQRRGSFAVMLAATMASACASDGRQLGDSTVPKQVGTHAADRPQGCPVTPPNGDIPPGQAENPGAESAAYLGNGRLWTVLPRDGTVRERQGHDGTIAEKFPWWRGVRGRLVITGHRLDAAAPPLRSRVPDGYGRTGFQSSAVVFPSVGCWRVTGTAGVAQLRFVTLVLKPPAQ